MSETAVAFDRDKRPLFVYGSLRPGELGHGVIAEHVGRSARAGVSGHRLRLRDGLPILIKAPSGLSHVHGDLLWPRPGAAESLIAAVDAFEPPKLYRQGAIDAVLEGPAELSVPAWTFLGRSPNKGASADEDYGEWSFVGDTLLHGALDAIARSFTQNMKEPHGDFWDRFVRLQGDFLTLCAVLERYTSLTYGPAVDPSKRISALRRDLLAQEALARADPPSLEVLDARTVATRYRAPGERSFDAWYQVRSNLVHRGKNAYGDVALLEAALVGLHDTLRHMLAMRLQSSPISASEAIPQMLRPIYEKARPIDVD